MKVEIFTLCDAATVDAAGKLSILGSFDRLSAREAPVTHPQCALAIKLRFKRAEAGQKRIQIAFVDSDGTSVMTIGATSEVSFHGNDSTATVSLAIGILPLRLPRFDTYSIDLTVDDQHKASIQLLVP